MGTLVWEPDFIPERNLSSGKTAILELCSVGRVSAYSCYLTHVHANGNEAILRDISRAVFCVDESMA